MFLNDFFQMWSFHDKLSWSMTEMSVTYFVQNSAGIHIKPYLYNSVHKMWLNSTGCLFLTLLCIIHFRDSATAPRCETGWRQWWKSWIILFWFGSMMSHKAARLCYQNVLNWWLLWTPKQILSSTLKWIFFHDISPLQPKHSHCLKLIK